MNLIFKYLLVFLLHLFLESNNSKIKGNLFLGIFICRLNHAPRTTRTRFSPDGCFSRLITDRCRRDSRERRWGRRQISVTRSPTPFRFALAAAAINEPRPHRHSSFCAPLRPPSPGVLERTGASERLDLCRLVPSIYRRSVPERSKLWISSALPLVPSVVPPFCSSSSSSSSHVSSSIRMRQRPEGSKKTDSMRYIRYPSVPALSFSLFLLEDKIRERSIVRAFSNFLLQGWVWSEVFWISAYKAVLLP